MSLEEASGVGKEVISTVKKLLVIPKNVDFLKKAVYVDVEDPNKLKHLLWMRTLKKNH